CHRRDVVAAHPRRRRDAEGAAAAGADGARDPAAPRPPAHHGPARRDGGGDRPAAAGLLRQAPEPGGDGRPVGGPGAGPLRPLLVAGETLGAGRRAARRGREGRGLMSLWEWTLEAYARPGVPEATLSLQDRHGQNTSYLLWAVWAEGPSAKA